jgi:hypothetical protein
MESALVRNQVANSSTQRVPDEIAQVATKTEDKKPTVRTALVLTAFIRITLFSLTNVVGIPHPTPKPLQGINRRAHVVTAPNDVVLAAWQLIIQVTNYSRLI